MASFITRVELHAASERDYENLHVAMRKQGFSRTITSDAGKIYNLPPAEYHLSDNIARSEVLKRAKSAAASTGRSAEVVVVEYTGCSWDGLTS
jgi:hypothetical protein